MAGSGGEVLRRLPPRTSMGPRSLLGVRISITRPFEQTSWILTGPHGRGWFGHLAAERNRPTHELFHICGFTFWAGYYHSFPSNLIITKDGSVSRVARSGARENPY